MPLVRYEVRCEHSLANPELYRNVVRDDSEGLLEGVAMAGLVGLVRQLGDLAEFAAEIFRDLHEDIVKIVSRGQNLKTRVTRLEADLPVVEKALVAKANQFRFAYTARSKWRAPLPMDQNLCAQGELPRFVRNFYDDCRGPPRLFLLDKFDGDGRGACVKRYTDPTFFRLTWATSQLEKAEQAELERQEQLAVQVQQERKSSMKKKVSNSVYPRERLSSAHFENLEGFTGDFTPELRSMRLDRVSEGGDLTPDEPQSPEKTTMSKRQQLPEVDQGPVLAPLNISAKDIENAKQGRKTETASSDDEGGSDFVDALTTVGSDMDSEHSRWSVRKSIDSARLSVDSEHDSHYRKSASQNHSVLKAQVEAQRQSPSESPSVEQDQHAEFAQRLDDPESSESPPMAGTVEWEHPAGQPAIEDPETRKTTTSDDDARINDHANIADSPTLPDKIPEPHLTPSDNKVLESAYDPISFHDVSRRRGEEEHGVSVEARDQSLKSEAAPQARQEEEQSTLANAEQRVTTPRSRRQWARDNGSGSSIMLSMAGINHIDEDSDVTSLLRARLLESTGASALVPHQGEEELGIMEASHQSGHELTRRSSSNASSPYTNISSSEVEEGFTSESASSSPKGGPNFCSLLSPPQSPPPRGLMGSYDANPRSSGRGSSPKAPPITPLLSSSPSVSRSSSIKHDASANKLPQNFLSQARTSPRPTTPQLKPRRSSLSTQTGAFPVASSAESSEKIKEILVTEPRRTSENGGLELDPSRSQDQASSLVNAASKPRTWHDRSESNVAATLRAIRQAAAVGSDDDTASECRSDCSVTQIH